MKNTIVILAGVLFTADMAQAQDYDAQLRAITSGLPAPAAAFIRRQSDCNHWAGEEPYDKARETEIARAEARLHCDTVERDEKTLRQRYRANAKVLRTLDRAQQLENE
jgi:hypothetical protein